MCNTHDFNTFSSHLTPLKCISELPERIAAESESQGRNFVYRCDCFKSVVSPFLRCLKEGNYVEEVYDVDPVGSLRYGSCGGVDYTNKGRFTDRRQTNVETCYCRSASQPGGSNSQCLVH